MKNLNPQILLVAFLLFSFSTLGQDLVLGVNTNVKNVYNFNGNQSFTGNIIIKSRAILTIKCGIVKFNSGKGIKVEKGGKLKLFNAILTQSADNSNGNSITVNRQHKVDRS